MTVREVLEPLVMTALKRLCERRGGRRGLRVSGRRAELLRRLTSSYRGNLSALVLDLRREDLLRIASWWSDDIEFPAGLGALRISELREVCLAVFEERYVATEGAVGAETEDSEDGERQSEGSAGGDFEIELHATGDRGELGARQVGENSLAGMAMDADSVTILSAYYVRGVLEKIAGACRGDVRMVLNGLGGRRLTKQAEDLGKLQENLRKQSQSAEIRLAFTEGVFHTKLYVFGTGSDAVAWIGSANATRAGLNGRNEEVLIRVRPVPRSVSAYVESAWSRAKPLECCRAEVNSLIAFFRTGMLYYKPYATLQWTINPFRGLMETLPAAEKRKITAFHSEFAEPEAGIGAFSLKRVFERVVEGERGELPVERRRVELRRYAVETCYGYWVAERYIEYVDDMLDQASAEKLRWHNSIRAWMETGRDGIVGAYASYLRDVRRILDEEEVEWREHAPRDLFEDTSAVEGRVKSLLDVLDTDHRLARHCKAFLPSEVPEIWEDDAARARFEATFFESLADAWSSRRRDGSSKLILESLDLGLVALSRDPAMTIRKALKCALQQENWYENNFR